MANYQIDNNSDLRTEMRKRKVAFWQIADAMGVHENTVARRFRHEITGEDHAEIMRIIKSFPVGTAAKKSAL